MTISMRASDVTERRAQAICGQLAEALGPVKIRTYTNYSPAAKQVTTVTVSSASDQDYTLTVNGVDFTYNASGSDTTTTIAAGLAALINANPLVRGVVAATSSAAVITLTSVYPGIAFTVTESETDLGSPSTTTANAAFASIGFGLAVMDAGTDSNSVDEAGALCKKVATSALTAQVVTITPDYIASAEYTIGVTFRGVTYTASTIAATDLNATLDALVVTLNARLPANSVLAASTPATATAITLTAEIVGEEFEVTFGSSDEGTGDVAATISDTKGVATSLNKALAGVSLYALDEEAATVGDSDAAYPGGAGVKVLEAGRVWVSNSQTIANGDAVYIDTDDAKFYTSSSSTRVLIPRARWIRSSRSGDGLGLALLEIGARN